jgi:hypothetical protein
MKRWTVKEESVHGLEARKKRTGTRKVGERQMERSSATFDVDATSSIVEDSSNGSITSPGSLIRGGRVGYVSRGRRRLRVL